MHGNQIDKTHDNDTILTSCTRSLLFYYSQQQMKQ